jgi:hypothetical protein
MYEMKITKFLIRLLCVLAVLVAQVSVVFAAPELITGTVQSITLETNTNTAVTTVLVTLLENEASQTVRLTIESAITLGLVILGGDGNPVINEAILGKLIEIKPTTVINDEQNQHPVGDALATFFSDITGLDYATIMTAHDQGTGFGVIAQALWLTRKLEGNAEIFLAILDAKKTKDFSAFVLDDGTTPANWGQFKKAVMDGKKGKPGVALADVENNGNRNSNTNGNNGNSNTNGNAKDKNKKDKENNGRGNGQDE